jgi:hypothetical protein
MTKPIIQIFDSATGEEVIREMTNAEFTKYEKDQAKDAKARAEAESKASTKAALLEKLGISDDEAKLLLG